MMPSRKIAVGVVLATIIASVITAYGDPGVVDECPRCLSNALIAIETATSLAEVREVVAQPGFNLEGLLWNLRADYALMFFYAGLFGYLGWLTRFRRVRGAHFAGPLIIAAAVTALGADFAENIFLDRVLDGDTGVDAMRLSSLAKWGAFGVAVALQWFTFLPKSEGPLYWVLSCGVAWLCAISGVLAIWGVIDNRKLEVCLVPYAGAILIQLALFVFFWDNYLAGCHLPAERKTKEPAMAATPGGPR